jgi:fatty-acyl-CoA synthase
MVYGNGMRPDVWNRFRDRFNIPKVCEFYAATEGKTKRSSLAEVRQVSF